MILKKQTNKLMNNSSSNNKLANSEKNCNNTTKNKVISRDFYFIYLNKFKFLIRF